MENESSILSQVAISLMPRLNSNLCLPLIERCGGIEGFFQESEQALQAICREFNISDRLFDRPTALYQAGEELTQIDKYGIRICSIESSNYPMLLRQCEDSPLVFYYKGKLEAPSDTKYLAIVGTRHASKLCEARVETVVAEICSMDHHPLIVSGLAYGIDASAHRASLKHGLRTFAVLGHGLHMIYPASHKTLAELILDADGALISEFPCLMDVHRSNFLKRNRIIAGLCHATLVAESAVKGGAMSTAYTALSYNRDVMAFPGRPEDNYSAGCNQLIKENTAALVENATDVARILNLPLKKPQAIQTSLNFFDAADQEQIVLKILTEKGDLHIDELSKLSAIANNELSALLLQLELENKILSLPGKRYGTKC